MREIKSGSYNHPYKSGTCILFYPYISHHAGYKIIELLHAKNLEYYLRFMYPSVAIFVRTFQTSIVSKLQI